MQRSGALGTNDEALLWQLCHKLCNALPSGGAEKVSHSSLRKSTSRSTNATASSKTASVSSSRNEASCVVRSFSSRCQRRPWRAVQLAQLLQPAVVRLLNSGVESARGQVGQQVSRSW